MPLEIEIKVKLDSHDGVREKLRARGAVRRGTVRETNVFFDRRDGGLVAGDCGLRVRFIAGEGKALLTYKGKRLMDALRSREAYDVHVEPGDQMVPMLEALGFVRVQSFEKDRETWEMDGCLVELDELPVLGRFLEIEGPSEEAVQRVRKSLGLENAAAEEVGYSKMVAGYLRGSGATELKF